jgi:hypothetical protein
MKRLATDRPLRLRLGDNAAAFWRDNHTVPHMVADYEAVFEGLMASAGPAGLKPRLHNGDGARLPAHLRPDGLEHTRALLALFGDAVNPLLP